MSNLISVIVPVYNVEKYMDRCIESIINQTYKNLEIILVNDGSTDLSGKKCDEWAQKDDRIKVIHKENGGVSSARNAGIDIATGDYIGFVDSDDLLERNMYEILIKDIKKYDVKISCCQMQTKSIDGTIAAVDNASSNLFAKMDIVNGFFFNNFIRGFIVSPCNKIIAKDILIDNNIRFKKYALAEDFLFIFEVLTKVDSIYYNSAVGYYYLHRENSAMTSKFSPKRFDYIYAITEIENICKNTYGENIAENAHNWVFLNVLTNYRAIIIEGLQKKYCEKFEEYKTFLKENNSCFESLNFKRKIDYILSLYFPFVYKILRR